MKAEKICGFLGLLVIILLAFVIIWNANIIGVAAGSLEKDAREEQNIASDWEMAQAVNDDLCAMLFYDEETRDHIYSIYMKKEGTAYGYFFSHGGKDAYIGEGVRGMIFDDRGIALLSMNEDKVCKIEVDNGVTEKIIEIDPVKPFVVVVPVNSGEITMYNSLGDVVSLYDTYR
ncbi:MAG: hypothetical protein NC420_00400 [Eubacterium sp.]|nr:hypothetical protein [Eubacterium sp.]